MIRLEGVSVERNERRILRNVSISFDRGAYYVLRGPTGSGKTTLLHVIAGLVEPTCGYLSWSSPACNNGHARAGTIGYVLQDPSSQVILPEVRDEIAFGPLNLGLPSTEVERRVEYWSGVLEVERVCGGNTRTFLLSGGQQQLVVLAAVFAMEPDILLLDEPTSMLDERNARRIQQCINRYREERHEAVIVHATHEHPPLLEPDHEVQIEQGGLRAVGPAGRSAGPSRASDGAALDAGSDVSEMLAPLPSHKRLLEDSLLACQGVDFSYKDQPPLLQSLDFNLRSGEALVILGGNGTGKSTLLDLLGGWLKPQKGQITIRPGARLGAVFQHMDDTLFAKSVRDELRVSLPAEAGVDREQQIDEVLSEFGLGHLQHVDVVRLSGGEKRLLAIAAVAVSRPQILLFDEPLLGLDEQRRQQVLSLFRKWLAKGKGLVIAANRIRDSQSVGDKLLLLGPGSYAVVDREDCSLELLKEFMS